MLVEVRNVTYTYNEGLPFETTALEDVSFSLRPGCFSALIGHTGSGKSTLLQILCGLIEPGAGSVLADGTDLYEKTGAALAARRRIGMVFQYPEHQLFGETVLADVCFGPKNLGLSDDECRERAFESLRLVGLDPDEKAGISPFSLSGGERRRAAIAGVLAMRPELLILDEPAAGLDPKGCGEMSALMRSLNEEGTGILLVSHDMDEVAALAKQVLVLNGGRVAMEGTCEEVFSRGGELARMGLSLPAPAAFMSAMAQRGYPTEGVALTARQAARKLSALFGKRGGNGV